MHFERHFCHKNNLKNRPKVFRPGSLNLHVGNKYTFDTYVSEDQYSADTKKAKDSMEKNEPARDETLSMTTKAQL